MDENVVCDYLSDLIRDENWGGACYASAAIMHTLLKYVGIESTPCIGVVRCTNGDTFDHGWLEVDGKIYDVALPVPQGNSTISMYVDMTGFRGATETPNFEYGIAMDLDSEAKFVSEKFENIMNHSPFWASEADYWEIAELIAKFHGFEVNTEHLVHCVSKSKWLVKRAQ